jgi:PrtD family type I secretion system ABC transporter
MLIAGRKIHPQLEDALKACLPHFKNAFLFSFLVNLLYLAPTLYMLQIYDRVMPTNGVMTLLFLSVFILIAFMVLALLDNLRSRLMMRLGARLDRLLSAGVLRQVLAQGARDIRQGADGFRFQNALRAFDQFKAAISGAGALAVFDTPWVVIYIFLCFLLHPILGLVCLFGTVIMALLTWLNERSTHEQLNLAGQAMARAHISQDIITQRADTVRALGMVEQMVSLQNLRRRAGQEDGIKAGMVGGKYRVLSKVFRLVMQSAGMGIGALLAIDHLISPGAVFAASLLISRAMSPIDQVITSWKGLVGGYNAFFQIDDLFQSAEAKTAITALPDPQGLVQVENLTVVNTLQRRYFLQGVTFQVNPSEILAIVGPSGAGKTTLARVIVGADQFENGYIRFDGADRRDWDPNSLARFIGYVPQETVLFEGTVRDNICRFEHLNSDSNPEDIDAFVVQAAKDCSIHEIILRLPKGYNTELGPNGVGLSAGQSQLVALARALYRRPKILVLDEPNSNMDSQGEAMLVAAMLLMRSLGGSVIIIAHRAGVINHIDKILVLEGGRVQYFGDKEGMNKTPMPENLEGKETSAIT